MDTYITIHSVRLNRVIKKNKNKNLKKINKKLDKKMKS